VPDDLELPPTYREIADLIRAEIDKGTWPYGSQLPSARELATLYNVAMATIHRATGLLVASGDVVGRQGRGRFVIRR
jgi:DNA-binding GntR family transcriptional regulator